MVRLLREILNHIAIATTVLLRRAYQSRQVWERRGFTDSRISAIDVTRVLSSSSGAHFFFGRCPISIPSRSLPAHRKFSALFELISLNSSGSSTVSRAPPQT